jgi:DNA-directed RNA polymerase subunit K/omega
VPVSSEPPMLAAVGTGFEHRFLFVTVASRRVMQIRAGARPRVEAGSHKPTVVAVAEVLAGFVPYIA